MKLFNTKKKKEPGKVIEKKKIRTSAEPLSHVILRPHVTEKAAILSGDRQYTFIVAQNANKVQIGRAIEQIYKVSPISVNIISSSPRETKRRGRKVHVKGMRKAVVTLKRGDSIEFV